MECPNCQHEMIKSKAGWLCLNCGHIVSGQGKKIAKKASVKAKSVKVTETETKKTVTETVNVPTDPIAEISVQTPKTDDRPPRWKIALAAAGILLAVTAIALAGFWLFYIRPAKAAAKQFGDRLANSKTANLSGTLSLQADSFLSLYNSNLKFSGAFDRGPGFKSALNFDGKLLAKQYQAQSEVSGSDLFLNLAGPDLPVIRYKQSSFLYRLMPQWYKFKLDNSLYDNVCENRGSAAGNTVQLYSLLRQLKLNNKSVGFNQQLNGQPTTHFIGSVDGKNIPALLDQLDKQLPLGCTPVFKPSDLKNLQANYELWTGKRADRVKLALADKDLGVKLNLTLDLSNYNQPVSINPPASFIDLPAVFAEQDALLNRDAARRADIAKLQTALEAYKAAKKLYPSNLYQLVPTFLTVMPTDPRTGRLYNYASNRKTYSLSANFEEPNTASAAAEAN